MNSNTFQNYVKVSKLCSIFKSKRVSLEARELYRSLAEEINFEGNKVKISNKDIEALLELSERQRKKFVKELVDKGFIDILKIKGAENIYFLKVGVFKGTTEKPFTNYKISYKNTKLSRPTESKKVGGASIIHPIRFEAKVVRGGPDKTKASMSGPQDVYTCSSSINSQINNKQQHNHDACDSNPEDVDFFSKKDFKITFSKGSVFGQIQTKSLLRLIKKFGRQKVQDRITKLEQLGYKNEKIQKSAAGLLYKALIEGDNWEFETKETLKQKQIEEERQRKKELANYYERLELREKEESEQVYGKEDEIFTEAKTDKSLVNTVTELLQEKYPDLKQNNPDYFNIQFRYKLLEMYKKKCYVAVC